MRPTEVHYPVDRYLVESSKKYDMVNIIDDDIWNSEPALRPEDEIILRKLHDMLQSTADDLKLLSGELSKYHQSDVQKKSLPTPMDEEFNEKVHIEEVVNAKFHRHKLIETERTPNKINKNIVDGIIHSIANKSNVKKYVNHGVQVTQVPTAIKPCIKRNLKQSRTNIIEINDESVLKNVNLYPIEKPKKHESSVSYNEFSYKYAEPKQISNQRPLKVQKMPSINIRSELKEQKVLQLDIIPENNSKIEKESVINNALVIETKHEDVLKQVPKNPITFNRIQYIPTVVSEKPTRKVSKMPVYESSESANNVSSESHNNFRKQKTKSTGMLHPSPSLTAQKQKKSIVSKKDVKRPIRHLEEWQKKLNAVYGSTSKLSNSGVKLSKPCLKRSGKQKNPLGKRQEKNRNNTEYIPYSRLTLGGVNVSDIEREIFNIPNSNEIALSPILDRILSSRENSFHKDSPKKNKKNKSSNILTTSDENLLQEVLDIEEEVTRTLTKKNLKSINELEDKDQNNKNNSFKDGDSYDDDFEDEKSDESIQGKQSELSKSESLDSTPRNNSQQNDMNNVNEVAEYDMESQQNVPNIHNRTYTKISNLSFKNSVDIFEFVHSVETQETGTQSNTANKTTPSDTQISPNDNSNTQAIHNDLWPSIDPRGEVEKMFKLEKDFIKKLIIDEYGDLLEKRLNKPSTSKNIGNENSERNVAASQKNTQTSPAHVKCVMTSPTRTKTRTTSPFALSLTVNQQTSPIVVVSNEEDLKVEIENDDDLGISVNLSSPRFSLRLPQTSREVISNMKQETYRDIPKQNNLRNNLMSSSSSAEDDYYSSDISSLGEINKMYNTRLKKSSILPISDISSSSLSRCSTDPSGAIIPLRSEGEASIGQINKRKTKKHSKSEGEISFGQLN